MSGLLAAKEATLLTKQFLDDVAVVFTIARLEECDAAIDKSDTKFCVGHDDISFRNKEYGADKRT